LASLIFRKGLELKSAVAGTLAAHYHSSLIDKIKADDFTHRSGRLTIYLAREFGFCYGVDRAVDYAYQARQRFPSRNVYLTGEIIHNPHVNSELRAMNIRFLSDAGKSFDDLGPDDVVILPAFGVTVATLKLLERRGCTLVDTTCGSVLNVWKNVRRFAADGCTAVIHGKIWHEETQATASQAVEAGGRYLVVLDQHEAEEVSSFIRGDIDADRLMERIGRGASEGFDPDRHLQRIGVANQTTMLMSESLQIAAMLEKAMIARYGEQEAEDRFRVFDTICSATQDRQDAVISLLETRPIDLMLVIGGYNSSNTCNLARICARLRPTYHVADPGCLVSAREIRHQPRDSKAEQTTVGWLPASGPVAIGLTSGASTPDNLVETAVTRLEALCTPSSAVE
jgi:4-hydroxy-3-methylbut-2-en-1-yl diphosphate reductase